MRLTVIAILLLSGCSDDTDTAEPSSAASDASWEELSEADLFGADKDTGNYEGDACGEEVVEGEACEGHWSETMCIDEHGEWWWCEEGVWTSDKDE